MEWNVSEVSALKREKTKRDWIKQKINFDKNEIFLLPEWSFAGFSDRSWDPLVAAVRDGRGRGSGDRRDEDDGPHGLHHEGRSQKRLQRCPGRYSDIKI